VLEERLPNHYIIEGKAHHALCLTLATQAGGCVIT
jgi:hypothetical protein